MEYATLELIWVNVQRLSDLNRNLIAGFEHSRHKSETRIANEILTNKCENICFIHT